MAPYLLVGGGKMPPSPHCEGFQGHRDVVQHVATKCPFARPGKIERCPAGPVDGAGQQIEQGKDDLLAGNRHRSVDTVVGEFLRVGQNRL